MTVSNMYIIIYILIFSLCASSLKVSVVKDTQMTSSERFLTKFNLNKNLLAETGRVAMKSLRKPLKMNRIFPQRSDKLDSVSPFELDTRLKILLTLRNLNHRALYKRINHVHNKLISWIEGSSKDRSPFPGHLAQHSFHQKVTSGSNSIRMKPFDASKRFTFVGNSTQDSEEFFAGGNSTQASEGTSASINSTQKQAVDVAKRGNNNTQQAASVDTRNRTRSLKMTGKVSNEIERFVIQPYITFHLYVFIRLTYQLEVSTAKRYEFISADEKSVANKPLVITFLLNLQWVLLRTKKSFLHFMGHPNFINDRTKLVPLQTLAHVQLRVLSKVLASCLTAIKIIGSNITKQFTKGKE